MYVCNGYDLDVISDAQYDIVFSTIALQHIARYSIRFNYYKEFYRVLKPGGWLTAQVGSSLAQPYPPCNHVDYYDDREDIPVNSDSMIPNIDYLIDDLTKRLKFINFSYETVEPQITNDIRGNHPEWLFFRAQKA